MNNGVDLVLSKEKKKKKRFGKMFWASIAKSSILGHKQKDVDLNGFL